MESNSVYCKKKKCGYSILTLRLSNSSTLCNISFFFVIAVQHPTMCLSVLWSVEFLFWRLLLTFSHVAFVAFVGGEWPIRGHVQRQRTLANAFPECFYQPAPPAAERGMQAPPPRSPSILGFVVGVIVIILEGVGCVVVHLASLSSLRISRHFFICS